MYRIRKVCLKIVWLRPPPLQHTHTQHAWLKGTKKLVHAIVLS